MIRKRPAPRPDRSFAGAARDRHRIALPEPPAARQFAGVRRAPVRVDGSVLTNGSVTGAKIADDAVVAAAIADGAITTAKLADAAVTVDKIEDAAVTRDKLADAAVSTVKLGGDVTTAGKALLTAADATAQRSALALGTAAVASDAAFAPAVHTHAASDVTSGTMATARLGSGTANSGTFLRGDQSWAAPTASVALNSTSVAFTDGDTIRRVTVTDASVGATDKILCSLRRPDTTDDSEDAGHLYFVNVVEVAAGSFDAVVVCCDRGMGDTTEQPPNETIQLVWTRAA